MQKKVLGLLLFIFFSGVSFGKGNLSVRPTKLEELVLGADKEMYKMSQTEYRLETGKAYSLEVSSTGYQEYAFRAPEFFENIWLRKVEAGNMEIKAPMLHELEFETEAEAEIFFVPIKPGKYKFYAAGLEKLGMVGYFIVE